MTTVCLSDDLTTTYDGALQIAPWSVPRPVADVMAKSSADGQLLETSVLPGKLLIESHAQWRNETPVEHMLLIRVTRASKHWITSNPNAVQFRDRWSWGIDQEPAEPVTSGYFNSQCGSADDLGTNTIAEPNPGKFWHWWGATTSDELIGPVKPGSLAKVRYRMYVWTPPPWSDNANKSSPDHQAFGGWARIQVVVFPEQGNLLRPSW